MYGFIYNTLRDLVLKNYGEEKWFAICDQADVEELKEHGLDKHYYDEAYLNRLVDTACTILSLPKEAVLESFGGHFFETIKISGHSTMLRSLGHNLYGFLMNLDALHDHLSVTYDQMQAPSFRCEKTKNTIILHYNSKREGLHYIVSGIVRSVAKQFFSLEVDVTVTKYEKLPQKLCHHYIFQVSIKDGHRDELALERLKGKPSISDLGYDNIREASLSPPVEDTDTEMSFEPSQLFLSHSAMLSPPSQAEGGGVGCPFSEAVDAATAASTQANRSNSTGQMITIDPPEEEEDTATEDGRELAQLRNRLTLAFGDRGVVYNHLPHSVLPELPMNRVMSRRGSTMSVSWPISMTFFQNTFPFHIIFDRELIIRYMGVSLSRLFPNAIKKEHSMTEYFELSRPAVKLTYQNIKASLQNVFVIRTKDTVQLGKKEIEKEPLYFRGQMIMASGKDMVVFIASPRIKRVEDLEMQGLYLSDIPVHDVTRDLILLSRHLEAELHLSAELEETKQALEIEKKRVEEEKKRADELLYSMLPQNVADQLKGHKHSQATHHESVSILFSDIKGFTTICNKVTPIQVVKMLNDLYTKFDSLLEKHGVYKVETIGDAYMVAAGLQDSTIAHAEAVTNMAFDMRARAGEVVEPGSNKLLQIRVGIHTGYVVAGVVGTKMPRYCLFGDTVNMASRMESHGEADFVHISEATFNQLQKETHKKKAATSFTFYSRGEIYIKGLTEPKRTYFVEPAPGGSTGTTQILVLPESTTEEMASPSSIPAHMHTLSYACPPPPPPTLSPNFPPHPPNDTILRSPSFVVDEVSRIVKPTSRSSLVRFTSTTSSVYSDDDGLEMMSSGSGGRRMKPSITLLPPMGSVPRGRSASEQWGATSTGRLSGSERTVLFKPVSEENLNTDEVFSQASAIEGSNETLTTPDDRPAPHEKPTAMDHAIISVISEAVGNSQPPAVSKDTEVAISNQEQSQTPDKKRTCSATPLSGDASPQTTLNSEAAKTPSDGVSTVAASASEEAAQNEVSLSTPHTAELPSIDEEAAANTPSDKPSLPQDRYDLVSTPLDKAATSGTSHDKAPVGIVPPNKVVPSNTAPSELPPPNPPESPGTTNNVFVAQSSDEIGSRYANSGKKVSLAGQLEEEEEEEEGDTLKNVSQKHRRTQSKRQKCVIS